MQRRGETYPVSNSSGKSGLDAEHFASTLEIRRNNSVVTKLNTRDVITQRNVDRITTPT